MRRFCFILPALLTCLAAGQQVPFFWLKSKDLKTWELFVDHDRDGVPTQSEYFAGTDPFDPLSTITASIRKAGQDDGVSWNSMPGVRFQLLSSLDLVNWVVLGDPLLTVPGEILVTSEFDKEFYGIAPLAPLDSDGDGEGRTTTDLTGAYEFLDLPPVIYEVRQILKSGETQLSL